MKDGQLSTAWKIALVVPWSEWYCRGVELGRTTVANDVHLPKKSSTESRHYAVLEVEMDRVGSQASTQSFITLDISFMLNIRGGWHTDQVVWVRVVAFFIGHRWIWSNFRRSSMGATIRLWVFALQLRPEGTESRSVLAIYVSKNEMVWVADICLDGNPFYFNMW